MRICSQPSTPASSELSFSAKSPAFLITIDTEGDNLWSCPREVTTVNACFLPRFQQQCERWGMKPTYLVDYDMGRSLEFIDFGLDAIKRSAAEIGMHLHPWNTPPGCGLTDDDMKYQPYLIEYPEAVIRDKIALMTELLAETFGVSIRSHRAGRWAFDEVYAKALIDHGYWVDCSVTPHVTWREHLGDPTGKGGADYRDFPGRAYWLDPGDIGRAGNSPLLEVPMSIRPCRFDTANRIRRRLGERALISRALNFLVPCYTWFRPKRENLSDMLGVLRWAKHEGIDYVEFMLHSSEFMPGGSPTFVTEADIEKLYESLEVLFETATDLSFSGATLTEYYTQYAREETQR